VTHRSSTRSTSPSEDDTRGRIIFDAVCAPIVIGIAILLVAQVFDQVSEVAGQCARWVFFGADAVWGVGMLWVRLRRLRKVSVAPQRQNEG
jgi:hypothetical protein